MALAAGAMVASSAPPARAATQGPCDIYAAGGTPCVAAHSTTRALYAAYNGPLYQVRRASDNTTTNISPLSAGGVANAATQDSFCAGTTCVITEIYDQSGHGNNLTDAPGGGAAGGPDNLANATAAPVTVGGHKAYGVYVAPGTGYRDDNTSGIATGDDRRGRVRDLRRHPLQRRLLLRLRQRRDQQRRRRRRHHGGHLLRQHQGLGLRHRQRPVDHGRPGERPVLRRPTPATTPTTPPPATGSPPPWSRASSANQWAILGGNAQSGGLATDFSGARPSGYNPMHKQGAIILGTGGDNSNGAVGTFYEGVMTSG